MGIIGRTNKKREARNESIVRLYKNGALAVEIAAAHGLSEKSVRNILSVHGVIKRKPASETNHGGGGVKYPDVKKVKDAFEKGFFLMGVLNYSCNQITR